MAGVLNTAMFAEDTRNNDVCAAVAGGAGFGYGDYALSDHPGAPLIPVPPRRNVNLVRYNLPSTSRSLFTHICSCTQNPLSLIPAQLSHLMNLPPGYDLVDF